MNIVRKLLIKIRLAKPKPHERAELGQGTWGRTKAEPKASISVRVIRTDGTIEDLGIISGGKR